MIGKIAETILQQLGGNRFIVMTGAKNFMDLGDGLSFKFPKTMKKINYVKIKLNYLDLYNITFGKITKGIDWKLKIIKKGVNDIYADQLQDIFTKYTGLYTSL